MDTISAKYKVKTWTFFVAILKNAGVKEITLGGKYLDTQDEEKGMKSMTRCLGEAYDFVASTAARLEGIKVNLSDVSFPLKSDNLDNIIMFKGRLKKKET